MVTRCQDIHETLHIIYTDFSDKLAKDSRCTTKARTSALAKIHNIIEDAFIEAAGASEFDNMALYLYWGRVSRLFANTPSAGTIQRTFETIQLNDDSENKEKLLLFIKYLNYFIDLLLYPMIEPCEPNEKICRYIESTKQLFLDGSICGNPKERFIYSQKIFDIIEPLIPENDVFDESAVDELFGKLLGGSETHSGKSVSINSFRHNGKTAAITRRLFTDLDGNPLEIPNHDEQYCVIADGFEDDKNAVILLVTATGQSWEYSGMELKASIIHKDIKIKVERPKPNLNLKKAYQNICNKYKLNINSYNARFLQLLKGLVDTKEDKFTFGSGIASKRLGDTKKRYWFRNVSGIEVPDLAILFLIDGSGSMEGLRRENAMISSVILHEVLAKNGIEHAIVEHRAVFGESLVKHNILVDFNFKQNDKYNILALKADEGTREGLSLCWAEKYLLENSTAEHKVIVAISDGFPYHTINDDTSYEPPVSIKDSANAVKKISKHGIDTIGIALDEQGEDDCYQALKEIYPTVVACDDLKHLTGQLLTLVTKLFS